MRIDLYTKFIMTLMAVGLLLIGLKGFVPPTMADSEKHNWQISTACGKNYLECLVWALNRDTGTIKVFYSSVVSEPRLDHEFSVYDD